MQDLLKECPVARTLGGGVGGRERYLPRFIRKGLTQGFFPFNDSGRFKRGVLAIVDVVEQRNTFNRGSRILEKGGNRG